MPRRPDAYVVYLRRRRWPTVLAAACGIATLAVVWSLVGFLLALLAGVAVGGLTYRYFGSLGR